MKKNEVKRKERKSVRLSLRITKEDSDFMNKEKLSPNAIFSKAISELRKEK